jgi:hypothetical protein
MTRTTLSTLTLALLLSSCSIAPRDKVDQPTTTPTATPASPIVITLYPGHKLTDIKMDRFTEKVWLQTRPAAQGELPGSLLESAYDLETGRLIKTILIIEQAGAEKPKSLEAKFTTSVD